MALAPINPTNITPPRVAFIDERSGAISREWYRFFLSLRNATQSTQEEVTLSSDTGSLLATNNALLDTLAQATQTQPDGASASDLAVVQSDIQALESTPPSASASDLAVLQAEVFGLELEPRAELGTIAAKNIGATGSFLAGIVTVTVVDGIITSIV
jgi:hypothetical protein